MYYPMIIPSFDEQERMIADRDSIIAVKDSTIAKWQEWARERGYKEEEFPQ